jgi:hypothetical protein
VFYNATRKLVLKGADAIVFVADSEVGKMEENKESLANLRANLAEYGLTLDSIPWVLQYNKRDLPNVYSVDELNAELNPAGVPSFEAVASEGKGVFETFRGVSHLLMEKVTKDLRRTPGSSGRNAHNPPAPAAEPAAPATPVAISKPSAPAKAPGQAIRREAQEPADAPIGSARFDYGTELELPAVTPSRGDGSGARNEPLVATEGARNASLARPAGTLAPDSEGAPHMARQIVVPVKLPPGGHYEIVIRLELDTNA